MKRLGKYNTYLIITLKCKVSVYTFLQFKHSKTTWCGKFGKDAIVNKLSWQHADIWSHPGHYRLDPHLSKSWSHLRPGVQLLCLLIPWQSDLFWQRYDKFHIWLWKFKVKVTAKVKPYGPTWVLNFNCLLLVSCQSDHFWLKYSKFHIRPWEFKVKVMAKFKPDDPMWGLAFKRYFCFFMAVRPFLAEI